jgi:HK97 family phage major capsid protein
MQDIPDSVRIPAELFELRADLERDWSRRAALITGPQMRVESPDRLTELQKAIDEKKAEVETHETAVAEHRKSIEGAPLEELRNPQSDLMQKADQVMKPLSQAKSDLADLEHAFRTVALMQPDGGKSLKDKDDPTERDQLTALKDLFNSESIGMKSVASEAYKRLKSMGAFADGSQQGTGVTALSDPEDRGDTVKALKARQAGSKALLTGQSASGASLLVPQFLPGIDVQPQVPLNVLGLVSIGSTSAQSVKYRRLLSRVIRAAAVPEAASSAEIGDGTGGTTTAALGGLKPESDLLFEAATAEVSTFAHLIPMTRNEMDDAEGLAAVVDSEMRLGVEREAERQLVQGTGTNDELQGVLHTPGIASYTQGTAPHAGEPRVDAIHRLFTLLRIVGYFPTALLIHPNDWQEVRLSKDQVGNYIYGPPSQVGAQQVWGVPIVESIAVPEGKAVGAEWARLLYLVRSGLQTFVSDSHKDWFARNLLALLAEQRGMSIIRRPQAFGEVDFA